MKNLILMLLATFTLFANNNYSKIHTVIYQGEINAIKETVANSTIKELEGQTTAGVSPLHMAIKLGRVDIVELLLSKEIDIDLQDKKGNTPLHYAIAKSRLDIVKMLVNKEADIEISNKSGIRALHQAAYTGDIKTVTYLVDRGAQVDTLNEQGTTPCQMALARRNMKVVSFLMELTKKECLKVPAKKFDGNTTKE